MKILKMYIINDNIAVVVDLFNTQQVTNGLN